MPVQPIGLSVSKGMEISFLYNPPTPSLVVLDEYHILPAETVPLSDGPGVKLFLTWNLNLMRSLVEESHVSGSKHILQSWIPELRLNTSKMQTVQYNPTEKHTDLGP